MFALLWWECALFHHAGLIFEVAKIPSTSWKSCRLSLPYPCGDPSSPNSQVVYYIDNESARLAFVRGDGETLRASKLIQVFVEAEARLQHRVWFGRVPSFSNPADSPSRLKFDEVKALGAMQTNIDWEKVAQHLELETGAESGRC